MNNRKKNITEVILGLLIIVSLFLPYDEYDTGIRYIINDFDLTFIPIFLIIPFVFIQFSKSIFSKNVMKIFFLFFLILNISSIGYYSFLCIEALVGNSIFNFSFGFLISLFLSITLLIFSLLYIKDITNKLKNILLSNMSLPLVLFLLIAIFEFSHCLNYGGYIINISFLILYIMAFKRIIKN